MIPAPLSITAQRGNHSAEVKLTVGVLNSVSVTGYEIEHFLDLGWQNVNQFPADWNGIYSNQYENGQTVLFRARSVGADGHSDYTAAIEYTIPPKSPLPPPPNFQANFTDYTTIASFTWDGYDVPVDFYELETGDGENFYQIGQPAASDRQHPGWTLAYEVPYVFRLRAINIEGFSEWAIAGPWYIAPQPPENQ